MDKDSLQPRTWKTWAEVSVLLQTLHDSGQSFHTQPCSMTETICQGWSSLTRSLLKWGTFWPSPTTTTCGAFLVTFLLQHRRLPDHCELGKEKSLLKTAQSFVAELIVPWFRGLRQACHQAVLAQGKWWQHTAKAHEPNPPFHGQSSTTTAHPPGLASLSSSRNFHPLQAPLLQPLSLHIFHLSCSHNSKSHDVSQEESDYFRELNRKCLVPPFVLPRTH